MLAALTACVPRASGDKAELVKRGSLDVMEAEPGAPIACVVQTEPGPVRGDVKAFRPHAVRLLISEFEEPVVGPRVVREEILAFSVFPDRDEIMAQVDLYDLRKGDSSRPVSVDVDHDDCATDKGDGYDDS